MSRWGGVVVGKVEEVEGEGEAGVEMRMWERGQVESVL